VGIEGDVSNLADLDKLYNTVKGQKGELDIPSIVVSFSTSPVALFRKANLLLYAIARYFLEKGSIRNCQLR
jgi:hypothetical protein